VHHPVYQGLKNTGEAKALASLSDNIELHTIGTGFTWDADDMEPVRQAARDGWKPALEKMHGGMYDMLILDEMTYPLNYGFLDEEEVLTVLKNRPADMHVVITGRNAGKDDHMMAADLVTEMDEVKHPYQSGRKVRKGIEF
jgi:cob(I)alamin adenosyltransferase